MFFGMLALLAEFESDLIRSRTVEGMREAAKRGRLLGKPSNCRYCHGGDSSRITNPGSTAPRS